MNVMENKHNFGSNVLKKVVNDKCSLKPCSTSDANPDYCAGDPCQNGGVCYNMTEDYLCVCPSTFSGKNCTDGIFYPICLELFSKLISDEKEGDIETNVGTIRSFPLRL